MENTPCFNGSISAVKWGAGSSLGKQYSFTYDKINRLNSAVYTPNGDFSEEIGQYDKNGNILSLTRKGKVFNETTSITATDDIDDLAYSYAGNQLKAVTDHSANDDALPIAKNDFQDPEGANPTVEYQYDLNGNLQSDFNKGVFLTEYNLLNLPAKMQFRLGHKIRYSYDAEGVKRRAEYSTVQCPTQIPLSATAFVDTFTIQSTTTSDYCGNFIYENGILQRILTPEGYIQTNGLGSVQTWQYVYFLRDHLGNTRAQLLSSPLSNPTSTAYTTGPVTDYYPYGMEITPANGLSSNTNPYLYGGKELDRMHGLNEADFSARWLDNTVPGFTSPDPLLERHPWESPYLYCGNNPVNRIDPTGLDWCTNSPSPTHNDMRWLTDNEEVLGKLDNYTYHYKACYMVEGDHTYFFDGEGNTQITVPAVDVTSSTSSCNSMSTFGSGFGIAPDRSAGGESSGKDENGYQLANKAGRLLNTGEIAYGSAESGLTILGLKNGAQAIGKAIGFSTQQTAEALSGTLGVVSKVGKGFGIAGYGLSAVSIGSKLINGDRISAAEGVGFGISTCLVGAGWALAGTIAAPAVAIGALIYGGAELGSYIFTGNTVEENIFGK